MDGHRELKDLRLVLRNCYVVVSQFLTTWSYVLLKNWLIGSQSRERDRGRGESVEGGWTDRENKPYFTILVG